MISVPEFGNLRKFFCQNNKYIPSFKCAGAGLSFSRNNSVRNIYDGLNMYNRVPVRMRDLIQVKDAQAVRGRYKRAWVEAKRKEQ